MTTFKLRRGISSLWSSRNPVLADGEPGFDKTTRALKIGDGATAWSSLPEVGSNTYVPKTAPVPYSAGRLIVAMGTSITNASGATNSMYGYLTQAVQMLGNARCDFVEAGTPGYLSEAIAAFTPTVLDTYPTVSLGIIEAGANDVGQAKTLAVFSGAIKATFAEFQKRGIPVVITTTPPRKGTLVTTSSRQLTAAYNTWIKLWAPTVGAEVADIHAVLADPATGDFNPALAQDDIHPNNLGHSKVAQVVVAAINRTSFGKRNAGQLTALCTDVSLMPNPLMSDASGAGLPTGWFENGGGTGTAPTYTKGIADTTGLLPAGQWAQMDFDGTSSGGTRIMAAHASGVGAVGDNMVCTGTLLVEDVSGTWEADCVAGTANVVLQMWDQTAAVKKAYTDHCPGRNVGNVLGTGNTCWLLGPFISPWVIGAGTTGAYMAVRVTVATGKHLKVRMGAADMFNATTLGLSSEIGGAIGTGAGVNGP